MKLLKKISKWLVILAAIEIGLMSLLKFDLFGMILGSWPSLLMILYTLMGVAGVWGAIAMIIGKKK